MRTRDIGGAHGPFLIPAEPEAVSYHCERCARAVLDGEYSYPRDAVEDVRIVVDVGCNLGAFACWADRVWWPSRLTHVYGYDPNAHAIELARQNHWGNFMPWATTVERHARFVLEDNWGGSRTFGQKGGTEVFSLHPEFLPAADCLKVDAEGVELEVFEHYRHMGSVKVALFEWHVESHREPIERICRDAGLVQRKTSPPGQQGVQAWVRP